MDTNPFRNGINTLRIGGQGRGGGEPGFPPPPAAGRPYRLGPFLTWTHIALVRNGPSLTFYINGVPDASIAAAMDTNPFRNGINTLRIGGQGRGGVNRFFPATVDEVRLYNVALTQAQIQVDMATPIAPTPTFALTVTEAGTGSGTVTSSPAGINCGATCSAGFASGTVVTLTATPAVASVFTGWSGAGCSCTGSWVVTMSAAEAVSGSFMKLDALTGAKTGSG